MKHPSNRELFDYWNERRGERLAPERADIEPAAIRHVLGDTFVLEVERHREPSVPPRRHAALRAVRPRAEGRELHASSGSAPAQTASAN